MYAPKYRSWISDEERRESALNYKASVYIAEIKEMADKARQEFAEPVPAAVTNQQNINRMYIEQMINNPCSQLSSYGGLAQLMGCFQSNRFD
jgi:hypothetical protein